MQAAYGIMVEVESHPFELNTVLFMDWRDDHFDHLPDMKSANECAAGPTLLLRGRAQHTKLAHLLGSSLAVSMLAIGFSSKGKSNSDSNSISSSSSNHGHAVHAASCKRARQRLATAFMLRCARLSPEGAACICCFGTSGSSSDGYCAWQADPQLPIRHALLQNQDLLGGDLPCGQASCVLPGAQAAA